MSELIKEAFQSDSMALIYVVGFVYSYCKIFN